jgi:predicted molibdopterin-dependent oxidoreductase YjgC
VSGVEETGVRVSIDGRPVTVPEGATLLDACRAVGADTPTLCFGETLTPVNACRVCVVELDGARTLVPSCARPAEDGMVVRTDTDRVRTSRRMVLELLASSVVLDRAGTDLARWLAAYGADPSRYSAAGMTVATVAQPAKVHDELYVRDYAACVLCYKCVEACGEDHQNTFAIAVAGRGFGAHIATEFDVLLPDSACVYCGNCIAVCPTGALVGKVEWDLRRADAWRPDDQTVTQTVCAYCGVGCNLELHVQDERVVKVTSPLDHEITSGNLCVKGRFGWTFIEAGIGRRRRAGDEGDAPGGVSADR